MQYRGADIIVEMLARAGVRYMLGYPGHSVMELIDAAYSRRDRISPMLVRHEGVGSYAADGYFRAIQEPMAVFGHISPGATNLLSGVANAYFDSSSMIVITGEAASDYQGRGAYQEMYRYADAQTWEVMRPAVKRAWMVSDAHRLPEVMARALSLAVSGRPGPVHLAVTQNAMAQMIDCEIPDPYLHRPQGRIRGDAATTEKAADLLRSAERPAIIVGGGAILSGASQELTELAELLDCPVGTTIMGKGAISDAHALAMGTFGTWGTLPANKATREADVILALGTRFAEGDTSGWIPGKTFQIPPTKLIHVELESYEIGKYYPTEIGMLGDAKAVLQDLIAILKPYGKREKRSAWVESLLKTKAEWNAQIQAFRSDEAVPLHPGRLVQELRDVLPVNGIVVTDIGNHAKWIAQQFPALAPKSVIGSMGFAAMGFGTGAVLGAKLARPKDPVVAVVGDGCFTMESPALTTAVENDIPVVYCIFNDYALGPIRWNQKTYYGERYLLSEFKHTKTGEPYNPDFVKLAEANGAAAERVENPGQFPGALERALSSGMPYVLDVRTDTKHRWLPGGGDRVIRFTESANR